jgi:hypothetical protein
MSYRGTAVLRLAAALLAATAWTAVAAQGLDGIPTRLELKSNLTLPAITPAELLGKHGQSSHALRQHSELHTAPAPTPIVREIPVLWEVRMEGDVDPELLDVRYEFVSERGDSGVLSLAGSGNMPVRVRDRMPIVVETDGETTLIRGGAVVELDVGQVLHSGRYSGSLIVRVDRP